MSRTVLITGATSGIGQELARILASQNHTVVIASRDINKVNSTRDEIIKQTSNKNVHGFALELSSLKSVKSFAAELESSGLLVDTLVLNAGIASPPELTLSEDGFETTFATNHLGHYLLTSLLLPSVTANAKKSQRLARVVVVSSGTHDPANHTGVPVPIFNLEQWKLPTTSNYAENRAYSQSKLANALFGNDLAANCNPEEVTVAIYDPGFIGTTGLLRRIGWLQPILAGVINIMLYFTAYYYGSTLQASSLETSSPFLARLAVDEELVKETGSYYCINHKDKCSVDASDREKQIQLREFSEALLKEKNFL